MRPARSRPFAKHMCNVLYEDNHLLVVEKPPNLPVQADSSGDADLLTRAKAYIGKKYNKPGAVYLGLVHRLDRPVGGVLVLARTSKAAARLCAAFAGHRGVAKRYCALVCGAPRAEAKLEGWIARDETTGDARLTAPHAPGAKPASLSYRLVAQAGDLSLLDINLYTGRHHQIRVQLAGAGIPIWGDQRYNPAAKPGQQIALWAYSLTLEHPTKKEPMTFTSLPHGGAWAPFAAELAGLSSGVRVVYADADILVADKPRGMAVAMADGGADTLEERLCAAYGPLRPVHRLDVATAGLVLFARNAEAEAALSEAIRSRTIRKFYRCTVRGTPSPSEATARAWLQKDAAHAHVVLYDAPHPGAKEILTQYRVLRTDGASAVCEIELITGRTHQIRAHMAHLGHPLLGDDHYGDRAWNRAMRADALALTAVRLVLHFPPGSYLARLEGKTIALEPEA